MQVRSLARHAVALAMFFALAATAACGSDDPTGPSVADVAGSYTATALTATILGTELDMLQAGATFDLELSEDGSTSGHLFVPATDFSEVVDEDLAGTWVLDGTSVTMTQSGDTFLRDVTLVVDGTRLVGDDTFNNVPIHVELSRFEALDDR